MELKGTTAIITGSSGRLGSTIAERLAKAGCDCVCHYNNNKQRAEGLVEQIKKLSVKAIAVEANLAEPEQIENLFERAAEFGTPQVLINSAAVFSRQPLAEVTFAEAQRVLNLNLIAPILASRAFAKHISAKLAPARDPALQEPKAGVGNAESVIGKIINIADIGGIRPWPGYVLYCSSKAALIGATKALAKELAPTICVNSIAPGVVTWPSDFDESEKKRQLSFIPVRRIAEPGEVTEAIVFLLKNDYITGQVLNIGGGRCI